MKTTNTKESPLETKENKEPKIRFWDCENIFMGCWIWSAILRIFCSIIIFFPIFVVIVLFIIIIWNILNICLPAFDYELTELIIITLSVFCVIFVPDFVIISICVLGNKDVNDDVEI